MRRLNQILLDKSGKEDYFSVVKAAISAGCRRFPGQRFPGMVKRTMTGLPIKDRVKAYTRGITLLACALISASSAGCAGLWDPILPLREESLQIVELKKTIAETNLRLEELDNKFLLLQERLEATRRKLKKQASQKAAPGEPPRGLKVIKLKDTGPETKAETEKSPTKARKKKGLAPETDPEEIYGSGQNHFLAGRFEDARAAFEYIARRFPSHTLADNALYWIGESFYSEQRYEEALKKFSEAVEKYPGENKAPDAMLKMGYAYIELENTTEARATLQRLAETYPKSEAAHKAKKRLKRLSTSN